MQSIRIRNSGHFCPNSYCGANVTGRGAKLKKLHCHIKLTQLRSRIADPEQDASKRLDPEADQKESENRSVEKERGKSCRNHIVT